MCISTGHVHTQTRVHVYLLNFGLPCYGTPMTFNIMQLDLVLVCLPAGSNERIIACNRLGNGAGVSPPTQDRHPCCQLLRCWTILGIRDARSTRALTSECLRRRSSCQASCPQSRSTVLGQVGRDTQDPHEALDLVAPAALSHAVGSRAPGQIVPKGRWCQWTHIRNRARIGADLPARRIPLRHEGRQLQRRAHGPMARHGAKASAGIVREAAVPSTRHHDETCSGTGLQQDEDGA